MNWLNKRWLKAVAIGLLIILIVPHLGIRFIEDILNYDYNVILITIFTALAFFATYAVKAYIMIIPAPALYIAAGVAFPPLWAVAITYIGLIASFSLAYYNGNKLGGKKVADIMLKYKKISEFIEAQQTNILSLCFLSRLTPLPKDLLSMFFGAIKMPFLKYISSSLLGVTPVMIPTVLAGASISNPLSPEFLVPFGFCLAVSLIVLVIYKRQITKKSGLRIGI